MNKCTILLICALFCNWYAMMAIVADCRISRFALWGMIIPYLLNLLWHNVIIFALLIYSGYLVNKYSHYIITNNNDKINKLTTVWYNVVYYQSYIDIDTDSGKDFGFWLLCIDFWNLWMVIGVIIKYCNIFPFWDTSYSFTWRPVPHMIWCCWLLPWPVCYYIFYRR